MPRTILKNRAGNALDLDGRHLLVAGGSGENNVEDELAALRGLINNLLAASGALVFKGVANAANPLPQTGYISGWTYKAGESGVYAGQKCEPGDMIICVSGCGDAPSDSDWQVVQTNIDGAVTGPAQAMADNFAVFENAAGKAIADSGVKKADVSQAVAMKHEHANAAVIAALDRNADGNLTCSGKLVGDGLVDCVVISAGESIPDNLRDNGIVFEIQDA